MTQPHEIPELNYITFSGIVTQKDSLSTSSLRMYVIRFKVRNTLTRQDSPGGKVNTYEILTEAWGELAEEIDRNIPTGAAVLVEGSLVTRVFVDRNSNEEHHKMIVKASSVSRLDTRA
jgi:single-stranded DNA-binding protein